MGLGQPGQELERRAQEPGLLVGEPARLVSGQGPGLGVVNEQGPRGQYVSVFVVRSQVDIARHPPQTLKTVALWIQCADEMMGRLRHFRV